MFVSIVAIMSVLNRVQVQIGSAQILKCDKINVPVKILFDILTLFFNNKIKFLFTLFNHEITTKFNC